MPDAKKADSDSVFRVRRRYPGAAVHSVWERMLLWRPVVDLDRSVEKCTFLAGLARSGTTWLSRTLNYRNDFRHINEPFTPWRFRNCDAFPLALYLRPGDTSPKYVDACRKAAARTAGSWHMAMNPMDEPMLVPRMPRRP